MRPFHNRSRLDYKSHNKAAYGQLAIIYHIEIKSWKHGTWRLLCRFNLVLLSFYLISQNKNKGDSFFFTIQGSFPKKIPELSIGDFSYSISLSQLQVNNR